MTKAIQIRGLSKHYQIQKGQSFNALTNINLDLEKGEVLGIIGHNGAGKSTLLKILSRISGPSEGQIDIYGRLSSLLEVGTGFHPELSGRDNIYLNGSILGMKRSEIQEKFDEIVDFAGVGRFLDMPVKRYSSGMYVRLAFSVAAHLNAEILLIDEVLAVGDSDFQKKCLQRMESLSKAESRSIIFVSHNLNAVQSLCDRVVVLKEGKVMDEGEPEKMIALYQKNLSDLNRDIKPAHRKDREGDQRAQLQELICTPTNPSKNQIFSGEDARLNLKVNILDASAKKLKLSLHLFNQQGNYLSTLENEKELNGESEIKWEAQLTALPLMAGDFFWNCHVYLDGIRADFLGRACYFEVFEQDFQSNEIAQVRKNPGFYIQSNWK